MTVADIRQSYEKFELLESSLAADPFEQFTLWFNDALTAKVAEPNAMTLATTTLAGKPSARIVLLKGFDQQGFVFYTNYLSRKGHELAENPNASLLFFWPALERQIRIEGVIEKASAAESDSYFQSRPLGSRIGAWVSPQSQPITRAELEARAAELSKSLGAEPARPEHWGGYRLNPDRVEFWQGRPSRLHDRLVFQRDESQVWSHIRLAP
ncbi:pyridoxamine 5'-phosphate oxidase [Pollutimonas harenae]|uniref:Pyridoxine/pyridoxamine 5'-phosphate oxidase n=1 Tax=Pollutimonas harenae TaxID=657015 RepID=A0A853GX42_9BURK|nr:pyridoxamine 5'-phosphate oxidase [Pollutimonas harenae]NYT85316.1 pyridoxamine 5'-phosphate oxidase [Pollutimonas harenae]TEA70420.1 pyridoxamine 5'-phosphate oxidase [Pollutimonas harenae]